MTQSIIDKMMQEANEDHNDISWREIDSGEFIIVRVGSRGTFCWYHEHIDKDLLESQGKIHRISGTTEILEDQARVFLFDVKE